VAEWLGKGLQIPVHRFNSGPRLERSLRYHPDSRALSSGVERFLDAEEARGSNPLAPTRTKHQVDGDLRSSLTFDIRRSLHASVARRREVLERHRMRSPTLRDIPRQDIRYMRKPRLSASANPNESSDLAIQRLGEGVLPLIQDALRVPGVRTITCPIHRVPPPVRKADGNRSY
jgi:hypothetical protein